MTELCAAEQLFKMHKKLVWAEHVETLEHRGKFGTAHQMELDTFNKLLEILRPDITVRPLDKFELGCNSFFWKNHCFIVSKSFSKSFLTDIFVFAVTSAVSSAKRTTPDF